MFLLNNLLYIIINIYTMIIFFLHKKIVNVTFLNTMHMNTKKMKVRNEICTLTYLQLGKRYVNLAKMNEIINPSLSIQYTILHLALDNK